MQTSTCSPAAQGPGMAWACIWLEQLLIHPLRGPAQSQFPQRGQVAGRKIVVERTLGLAWHIHLAFSQSLDQVVRREVDDFDVVGPIKDRVRHGLAHTDAG